MIYVEFVVYVKNPVNILIDIKIKKILKMMKKKN